MKCSIPTDLAVDLHDLLLNAEQDVFALTVADESCIFSQGRGSAILSGIGNDYAFAIIAAGWCGGEHTQPWQIHVTGDAVGAFKWLRHYTTRRLLCHVANQLPLDEETRALCMLIA